ncbi:hypothetical protein F7725_028120 [Dissostichus mawsoni]|uniref:Uncharacterized protein n=1 Tax=Dissostichus mawsoni TaxID=36200 RepID=A0A7J5XEV0_DISMA|nr:hypothetical protein F7725_028120 [Dissostichus mawsoni]
MMFNGDIKLVADYFQRAIEMQPDMVEWNSWPVLALVYASKHSRTGLEDDILEKMRIAQEQDPENLYLAAHYLDQRAQRGERIEDEARELATKQNRRYTSITLYQSIKSKNHPNIYRTTELRKQLNDECCSNTGVQTEGPAVPLHLGSWPQQVLTFRCRETGDIGTENGNPWLGHIYNLRGFIQYRLGFSEDAQSFFNKAKQAFCKIRSADEGPWLVVNYGNLAWLHHSLGTKQRARLPVKGVHPETYAEKAYALLALNGDINLVADYFQRAIEMQPGIREWNTAMP